MEQRPLYDATNFSLNPDRAPGTDSLQAENTTISNTALATLLCPSDTFKRLEEYSSSLNYLVGSGTTYPLSPRNPSGLPITGVFYENSSVTIAGIRDGTSQTVCVSETVKSDLGGSEVWDGVSPINGFVLTRGNDNVANGHELTNYASQCSGSGLQLQKTRGSRWLYGPRGTRCITTSDCRTTRARTAAVGSRTATERTSGGTGCHKMSRLGAATQAA